MQFAEPILETAAVAALRPTQISVGFREVACKRLRWRSGRRARILRERRIPVVRGPGGELFILDRHHLARALYEEGVEDVGVDVVCDLSELSRGAFWAVCEARGWCHPFDAAGVRRDASEIALEVGQLTDDPYRSLAGALRRAGGFRKSAACYSEFRWADYLRRLIPPAELEADFETALRRAQALARAPASAHLPGHRGTPPEPLGLRDGVGAG